MLVPVAGRPEPLAELYEELAAGVQPACDRFEFVFVVGPAFAELAAPLAPLAARGEPIRVVQVGQAMSETALLRAGVPHCGGAIILIVPARRRIESAALGKLIHAVQAGADIAVARRWPRRDSLIHRVQARLFHALVARVAGGTTDTVSDVASGVRAMRRDLLERIPLYGEFARFLPVLARRDGYSVAEVPAAQHLTGDRTGSQSPLSYLRLLFDLLALFFLLRFTEKPLRFFGLVGAAIGLPGAAVLALVTVQRLAGRGMADRPLLLFGVLFVVLGIQMIALGLIGEIIVHLHAAQRPLYRLREPDR